MSVAAVAALTALVLAAWLAWFARRGAVEMLVYGGFAAACQVVGTQLWLGVGGWLTASAVAGVNVAISIAVLGMSWRRSGFSRDSAAVRVAAAADRGGSGSRLKPLLRRVDVIALLALTLVAISWLATSAWYLPPRGIDDINYHLPPLYVAVQTGTMPLLPMALREGFALPLGADLLALWPLVLTGNDRLIDVPQILAALAGVAVLHALARQLGARRADAATCALAFLFVPVVLGQAGSNYIDVTVAVAHFTLLYAALRFHRTGETTHLLVAGWATGFALGAKYTMLPLVVAAQPILLAALWRHRPRARHPGRVVARYAAFAACVLPLGAWWYWRNLSEFGDPMYPFRIGWTGLAGVPGTRMATTLETNGPAALADFAANPLAALTWPLRDPGLGSLHGGYGVAFWGLGVPALAWCGWRALRALRRGDALPALLWAQVPFTVALYLVTVARDGMEWDQRYILAVTGLGLCALAVVLGPVRRALPGAAAAVRGVVVAASALALVQLGDYRVPHHRLGPVAADRSAGTATGDYRYYRQSGGVFAHLGMAWDPLDFLTRDGHGLDVYVALPYGAWWPTPAYGSQAQNRIVNLEPPSGRVPDAVLYAEDLPDLPLYYVGSPLTPAALRAGEQYELVAQTEVAQLWIRRERLAEPALRARLADYYARAFAQDVDWVRSSAARLPPGVPVLTSSPLGPAVKYLELSGALDAPVRIVRPGTERAEALRLGLARVVTIDRPLAGFAATPVPGTPGFIENVAP